MNGKIKKSVLILIPILEKIFWACLSIYTAYEGYQFLIGNVDYKSLNDFLSKDIFILIIVFEVIVISLMRVAEQSHMKMLYIIVVVAVLAIAREMFLKHIISWEIALALLLTTISAILLYILTHKDEFSDFIKKFRE